MRLVGTKYQWLRNPANFTRKAGRQFKSLRESTLKTARAWALKEAAMEFFDYVYEGAARSISAGGTTGRLTAASSQ